MRTEACKSYLFTLYLDGDFVGQAILRLAVAVLHFSALLVSFLRLPADTKRCMP